MNVFQYLSRFIWGRFFYARRLPLILLLLLSLTSHGQFKFREPPNRRDPAALEQRQGDFIWQQFLLNRSIGSFTMEGVLAYRPHNAASRSFKLTLEGDWQPGMEMTTVSLEDKDGHVFNRSMRIIKGEPYQVEDSQGCQSSQMPKLNLDRPIFVDLPFSWSDLLMAYLDWETVNYVGPDRYLGRPAHRFSLTSPESNAFPARAVVTLDEDYAALLKTDLYDQNEELVKRLRVGGFKQFGDSWMFSELSWSNRITRESVKLDVQSFVLHEE